jgi:HSP20 family protein
MKEQTDNPQMKKDATEETPHSPGQQPQQSATKQGERQSSPPISPHEERGGQQRDMPTNGEQGRQPRGMTRRDWFAPSLWAENPFAMMRRFSNEMDRMMDRFREDFGFGRGWLGSRSGSDREFGQNLWSPQIEVCERDNQLIICADLPGLKKEDIHIETSEDALTIQGERRQDHEETHEGHRTSERSYGRFYRSIPLPKGVQPENAKATFQDGELKIIIPLPQQQKAPRNRRIEIQSAEDQQSRDQPKMSE